MAQVRGGDLRKLAVLFERHHRSLYSFFVHMNGNPDVSEDLVQDVFFRILRYRNTYADGRPFAAWMYQIARHASIDAGNKRKGELQLVSSRGDDEDLPEREPVSQMPGADEAIRKRQEIALLRRFQNLAYEEIAAILGCEIGTVKVRVFRATRALGEIYFELAGEKAS